MRKERIERIFCGLLQGRSAHDLTPEFLEGIAQVAVKAEAALSIVLTVEGLEDDAPPPPPPPPQLPALEVQG